MSSIINLVNQVFEIEQKINSKGDPVEITRNLDRIKVHLEELGYNYHNPIHERYSDTRTDCVASIVGDLVEGEMVISKVIKPIIFHKDEAGVINIVQKAVTLVEKKK